MTDSVTSSGLKLFIENEGGKHLRYMRGYKNVINKGIELNSKGISAPLMIETSGHGAMKRKLQLGRRRVFSGEDNHRGGEKEEYGWWWYWGDFREFERTVGVLGGSIENSKP